MLHRIVRAIASLQWPKRHASGRHRAAETPRQTRAHAPTPPRRSLPAHRSWHHEPVVRGEDTALVRPYLVAHERREEAQRQEERRLALWLAVHGVDIGPRFIHGVEVAA
ncbi:hypothetical protein [Streptomyces oceani]|uniref:Uncharacterized protein n=1 Tax=Streptomyces oceani TaxID=1075402 RepID=A0A1E7JVT3_9ACTN|nr:hypothetical protein [Streptomyces oceani]OEU94813.1 hypothetical protein AN216_23975 [Streptomyces oceani]